MTRLSPTLLIALSGMLAANAAAATDREDSWPTYWQAINRTCPAKHLDMLGPADLRLFLDEYKSRAAPGLRGKLTRGEHSQCRLDGADPSCADLADLEIIEKHHLLAPLAAAVCGHPALCRDQSDCVLSTAP